MGNFIICTLQEVLLGWWNQGGCDERGMYHAYGGWKCI